MREGEKTSSNLYKKHHADLIHIYQNQNNISRFSSYINPFTAIKHVSMTMAGTDFSSYINFQNQADDYRYHLSQTMNELQMEYISPKKESGSEGKTHVVGQEHWKEFSDFNHKPIPFNISIKEALPAIVSLLLWTLLAFWLLVYTSKKARAI